MENEEVTYSKKEIEKKLNEKIDSGALLILEELQNHGFEAYIVGGCVRDLIMDKQANDWDITTNALPEDVIAIFDRTIPTGIKHGTVSVMIENNLYELTTYRIDGEYVDFRRPENVNFSNNLKDDLYRRDFTINAMAYNKVSGLVDEFNGLEDIKNKTIRCVGLAEERFDEDALRIIRAIRFSAKLGFGIDKETLKAIESKFENLRAISSERINSEFEKIIEFDPDKISLLNEYRISEYIFNGYVPSSKAITSAKLVRDILWSNRKNHENTFKTGQVGINTFNDEINLEQFFSYNEEMKQIDNKNFLATIRACLLKECDQENLTKILKNLKYSNKDIEKTEKIFYILNCKENELLLIDNTEKVKYKMLLKRILNFMQDIELAKCALFAKFIEKYENPTFCFQSINDIIIRGECFSVSQLAINGRDIIDHDIAKGARIGYILQSLLEYVMQYPEANEKRTLLSLSRKIQNNNIKWRYDDEL